MAVAVHYAIADTISEMKTLNQLPTGRMIFVKDAHRGGFFYHDPSDETTEEDGGMVFVDSDGRRFKRKVEKPGFVNVKWWTGNLYQGTGTTPDNTTAIQAAIDYVAGLAGIERPILFFPPGYYYVTATLDFTAVDGWTVEGVPNWSAITIPNGVTIDGPIFNFNAAPTIRRYNTLKGIYFFSDSFNGKAKQAVDFGYNNRLGMYECRTSRISTETDVAINFAYEGLIQRCNFTGGRTINLPSNGLHLADEANAVKIDQCSIDNYIGNGSTILGAGLIFEGSKGCTIDTATIQQCWYGVVIGSQARATTITGGGYFEKNRYADISLGSGSNSGACYTTRIEGGAIKSAGFEGIDTAGLLINGISVHGLTCQDVSFDNADAIQINSFTNQVINDVIFNNCRLGDTVYGYRNLVDINASMYMDNIKVINPGSLLGQSSTHVTIRCNEHLNFITDFDTWEKPDGSAIDYLEQNGTYFGLPVWKKNTDNIDTMVFTLSDVAGLTNQILTFSCWVRFNGEINANDLIFATNQSDEITSNNRPLRPSGLSTTDFVPVHLYIKVGGEFVNDEAVKVKIYTRTQNLELCYPQLKLGFV